MTVAVNGGGGGGKGGGACTSETLLENGSTQYTFVYGSNGGSGTLSRFNAPTNLIANPETGSGGNGTATGGATNTTGGAGTGGSGGSGVDPYGGGAPDGSSGGSGGRAATTYIRTSGGLTVGAVISLTVGTGGSGGAGAGGGSSGSAGPNGSVVISWT